MKISALIFKKQDLEKLIKDYILSQLSNDKTFWDKSLSIEYKPDLIDIGEGRAVIDLKLSVNTYQNIDTNDLVDLLSSKSSEQINKIIEQMYGDNISEVKVNFWPFWVKTLPKDKNRVKIDLMFE